MSLVHLFEGLDSKEKIREFILEAIIKDWHRIAQPGDDVAGAVVADMYQDLIEDSADESALQMLEMWDEAALEIVLDRELFYTMAKYGVAGEITDTVGGRIVMFMLLKASPIVWSGRFADRVIEEINYNDIVNGVEMDRKEFDYQEYLLILLSRMNSGLPKDYWLGLEKNPEFLQTAYQIATDLDLAEVEELLVKLLKKTYEDVEADPAAFEHEVRWDLINYFEDELAYIKFLYNPKNEFEKYSMSISLKKLGTPQIFTYLPGPKVVILTGYEREGKNAKVEYIVIEDSIERGTSIMNMRTRECILEGVPEDVEASIDYLVNELETFEANYGAALAQVKLAERRKENE